MEAEGGSNGDGGKLLEEMEEEETETEKILLFK